MHRALEFAQRVQAGVAVVNAGTFGSEPHMPFGGVKQSGNGTREPGTEALDVYSQLEGHLHATSTRRGCRYDDRRRILSLPSIPARAGSKRVPDKNVRRWPGIR